MTVAYHWCSPDKINQTNHMILWNSSVALKFKYKTPSTGSILELQQILLEKGQPPNYNSSWKAKADYLSLTLRTFTANYGYILFMIYYSRN